MPFEQPQLVDCITCTKPVSLHAENCPHCGQPDPAIVLGTGTTAARLAWEQTEEAAAERRLFQARRQNLARGRYFRFLARAMLAGAVLSVLVFLIWSTLYALPLFTLGLLSAGIWLFIQAHRTERLRLPLATERRSGWFSRFRRGQSS